MSTQVDIPGYVAGTWVIDTARSDVSFEIRQVGVSTVHGRFEDFEGTIVTTENPQDSSVNAVIRAASVNTKDKRRDKHIQTGGYLNVQQHPTITFTSTGLRADGDKVFMDGDLTVRDITKPVTLTVDVDGFSVGQDGKPRARFSAHTEINRNDYGVVRGVAAAVIHKKVKIFIKVEANKQD
jgi:polyisoprenoid-binding protein YceI